MTDRVKQFERAELCDKVFDALVQLMDLRKLVHFSMHNHAKYNGRDKTARREQKRKCLS